MLRKVRKRTERLNMSQKGVKTRATNPETSATELGFLRVPLVKRTTEWQNHKQFSEIEKSGKQRRESISEHILNSFVNSDYCY